MAIDRALRLEREAKGIIDEPVANVLYIAHFTIGKKLKTVQDTDVTAFIAHVKSVQASFPMLPVSIYTYTDVEATK